MEIGHLFHLALTRPSSANARCLKLRHPFVSAAHFIRLSDNNNIRAAQWADYQWNVEWTDSPTRIRILIPDTGTLPRNDLPKKKCSTHFSRGAKYFLLRPLVTGLVRSISFSDKDKKILKMNELRMIVFAQFAQSEKTIVTLWILSTENLFLTA